MKKFFGFGSSTPPPPPPPSRPPAPPAGKSGTPKSGTAAVPGIVGKWKEPNGSDTTEFHADGTVVEKPASGENIRGRYQLEGAKLTIKLDGVTAALVFTATIKDEALEMKDPDGQVTQYRRV